MNAKYFAIVGALVMSGWALAYQNMASPGSDPQLLTVVAAPSSNSPAQSTALIPAKAQLASSGGNTNYLGDPSDTNVALYKPIYAPTIYNVDYNTEKANDGSANSGWSPSAGAPFSFLLIDLQKPYQLSKIEFVTRQDGDQPETRRNFEIWASNSIDFSTKVVLGGQGSTSLPYQSTFSLPVNDSGSYRYVAFVKTQAEYAYVSELRVFSPTADAKPTATDWMRQGKYGVFVHYLNGTNDLTGDWNATVNAFNVNTFADQMQQAGAGWVIFTLGQNSGYFASPNATYNGYTGYAPGNKTSTRDLPAELSAALQARGIRTILYLPSGAPEGDNQARSALGWTDNGSASQEFQEKWQNVIREWSQRYGTSISGWWFDGAYCQLCYNDYSKPHNYNTFALAAKAGNENNVIAFNSGIYDYGYNVSNAEDYIAGETNNFLTNLPTSKYVNGAAWHNLTFLGNFWAQPNTKYSNQTVIDYVRNVNNGGGVVTLDAAVYRNGTISSAQLAQLQALKAALKP